MLLHSLFFFETDTNVRTARLLLLMAVPIHIVYFITISVMKGNSSVTVSFVATYLMVVLFQISCLLYGAHLLVPFLWKLKVDPDNAAVPALMATADVLGTVFLTTAYFLLKILGDSYVLSSYDSLLGGNITSSNELLEGISHVSPVYPAYPVL